MPTKATGKELPTNPQGEGMDIIPCPPAKNQGGFMKELTTYNRVAGYLNKIFDLLNQTYFENTLSKKILQIMKCKATGSIGKATNQTPLESIPHLLYLAFLTL